MRHLISYRIKRWLEIVFYFFVASVTPSLGYKFIPKFLHNELSAPNGFWLIFCVCFILLVFLNRIAGFRFSHIKSLFVYPSFLLAVFLASLVIDYHFETSQVFNIFLGIPHLGFATTTYLLSLLIAGIWDDAGCFIFKPMDVAAKTGELVNKQIQNLSAEEIIKWAECDDPITSGEGDFLKFNRRVDCILEHLRKDRRDTVAILGYCGSGKTSLTKLIEERGRSGCSPKLLFIGMSCRGFNDSAAAQQAVLGQIIKPLSERVDCFAIKGMPARFVKALSGTSNYWGSLLPFVTPKDPDAQLGQLSPILRALDTRLVVVVEDTERNSTQFDLESIEELLNRFRSIPDISFVITVSPDAKIDFVRLCEHIEHIPDLEAEVVVKVVGLVREYCRKKFPDDIDPVERRPLLEVPSGIGGGYSSWDFQMAKLVHTPRKLKATIRRFCNTWDILHGEVDIDELLKASCLHVCEPKAESVWVSYAATQ
jgi:hypothetical protein